MFFLRRWGHRQLLASWFGYWIALLAVIAAPALLQYWRIARTDGHGQVSIEISAGPLEMAAWIFGPPLAIFVLWLVARPKRATVARESRRD